MLSAGLCASFCSKSDKIQVEKEGEEEEENEKLRD